MRERPIGDLVIGLKQLGADVDCFLGTDCPPVRVVGGGGLPGGKVQFSLFYFLFSMEKKQHTLYFICYYIILWWSKQLLMALPLQKWMKSVLKMNGY